ncbi:hypothetical protein HDU97_007950 [Phlyctochytrium planicorne]|nr:hypothetical protein HDU97_007950 [Phlyctochytrium planicorne]
MPLQDALVVVGISSFAVASVLYLAYRHARRNKLGTMDDITTASMAYNRAAYIKSLAWDKHSFLINGKPVLILSGEFHPWRIPDVDRWRSILEQYKAAGLNCIRIYFHWGYHSPAEGVYYFEGNRNMEYLLSLCEELKLFVLAAPGPYICAETQAGGIPIWVARKREVRIRHSSATFFKKYDPEYSKYCREWLLAILPIIARHQITNSTSSTGKPGCVLALQIENENFEVLKGIYPVGLTDDMRFLANVARTECGITVPLFHNDAFEEGSYIAYPSSKKVFGKPHFGLDLYSYDKYVVFAPTSTPTSTLIGGEERPSAWTPWKPETVIGAVDGMEKRVRGFGGSAATAPIFIAELQGGWFNHYQLKCTYDTIYNFYGQDYTKLLIESCFAQGVTAFNIYMFYGGTNWGTLGDPDVYTSYDYSACIREFNFLSGRARKLRLAISFARSFADVFAKTDFIPESAKTVKVSPKETFNRQRVSVGSQDAEFTFLRNFNEKSDGTITVTLTTRPTVALTCKLPFRESLIALGNYRSHLTGLHLLLSTAPIYLRTHVKNDAGKFVEVWFIQSDKEISGQMAFDGNVKITKSSKNLEANIDFQSVSRTSVVSFGGSEGFCALVLEGGESELYVVALTGDNLFTLSPTFEEAHWLGKKEDSAFPSDPLAVSWGAYHSRFNPSAGTFEVEVQKTDAKVFAILPSGSLLKSGFVAVGAESPYAGLPGLAVYKPVSAFKALEPSKSLATLGPLTYRKTDFDTFNWLDVPVVKDRATKDIIDFGFTSGHSFYKATFTVTDTSAPLKLSLDVRNRCVVYLNNTVIGGHTTYSLTFLKSGTKHGPDPYPEWKDYALPSNLLVNGENRIVVMVESYGLSRQFFILNDVRNGRGVLGLKLAGKAPVPYTLQISGVDVTNTTQAYGITGFPDESSASGWKQVNAEITPAGVTVLKHPDVAFGPLWFKSSLSIKEKSGNVAAASKGLLSSLTTSSLPAPTVTRRVPLRLALSGPGTAHVFVGGIFIARYRGNGDSVQKDFVVPEKLVENQDEVPVVVVLYGREKGDWVGVQFLGWEVAEGSDVSTAERWSGNLAEGGRVFATVKEVLKVVA